MKPSGPGLLFAGRFLITVSISMLVMGLLRFSISSWSSFGKLYFSKNLSISTEAWADEFETFIFQDRKKIKIIDADTVTLLKYFAKFKDRHFSVADVSDESICEW